MAPVVGSGRVCFLWGRFCVGVFDRNLTSVPRNVVPYLIYFKRNFITSVVPMRFAKIMLQ
jgi:hypothetical protein